MYTYVRTSESLTSLDAASIMMHRRKKWLEIDLRMTITTTGTGSSYSDINDQRDLSFSGQRSGSFAAVFLKVYRYCDQTNCPYYPANGEPDSARENIRQNSPRAKNDSSVAVV